MHTILFALLIAIASAAALVLLAAAFFIIYAHMLMKKRPLMSFYNERSAQADYCPYDQLPDKMKEYIVIVEDEHFFEHKGYRKEAIKKAFRHNRKVRRIVIGGSTITQQLVKNIYFHFRKSYFRKIIELIIAVKAERILGKEKILELYLNMIYYGNGKYGICDAARFYFDKDVRKLSINQMFILACVVSAPTAGNPVQHPEVFERLRNRWLDLVLDGRHVVPEEDAAVIRQYTAVRLDPELHENDETTRDFPQTIPLINERFGPEAAG